MAIGDERTSREVFEDRRARGVAVMGWGQSEVQIAKDLAAKGEIMLAGQGGEDELVY